jgi:hypothetical protein
MGVYQDRLRERDEAIYAYHVSAIPKGLNCPLCGRWSPLRFDSPQGVRLACSFADCGAEAIMPRVPLARAIRRRTA